MKTFAINASCLIAVTILFYACTGAALSNIDKGDYRPTSDEIATQCEILAINHQDDSQCLEALKRAR